MRINKQKFLNLLKEEKTLKEQGKFLRDYDKIKNNELNSYRSLLIDQIYWESREEYIKMLESFCNNEIIVDDFFIQFSKLTSSNEKSFEDWEKKLEEEAFSKSNEMDIPLNSKSYGFSETIDYLTSLVDLWDPDVTLQMNLEIPDSIFYGISEEFFKIVIKSDILPKLKEDSFE